MHRHANPINHTRFSFMTNAELVKQAQHALDTNDLKLQQETLQEMINRLGSARL